MMWWDDEDGDHGDERDWTQPEAWAPEDGGRPFRGTDPKELPDDELLRGFRAVKTALARQRRLVEDLGQGLPKAEARGEAGIERLEEARAELERLQAVERNWRGPAREARDRQERERRVEGARKAREGLEEALDRFLDLRARVRKARDSLRSRLSRLDRACRRDGEVRGVIDPLPSDLAAKLRHVAAQETVGAGVDLDRFPVEGEDGEDEARRQVVERPDEVVLVGEWSEEERRAKSTEHGGKPARVVGYEEVSK